MYFTVTLNREEFLGWLGQGVLPNVHKTESVENIRAGFLSKNDAPITLVWNQKPSNDMAVRPIVLLEQNQMQNFFAFVSTYVASYSPFTAFFRVLSFDEFASVVSFSSKGKSEPFPAKLFVGIIIAEAFLQIGDHSKSISDITIQACLATLSDSMATALLNKYRPEQVRDLSNDWSSMRRLLSNDELKLSPQVLTEFWKCVTFALNKSTFDNDASLQAIVPFVRSFIREQEIDFQYWNNLIIDLPELHDATLRMKGTRESRVQAFDHYMNTIIAAEHIDRRIREVVAGLLISLVADGSFDYLQLLNKKYEVVLPATNLWFALFASLHLNTNVLTIGECLGRRICQKFDDKIDIFTPPCADVSVGELKVLVGDKKTEFKIRTEYQSSIKVEVSPGIIARFRMPRMARPEKEDDTKGSNSSLPTYSKELSEAKYLLEKAHYLIDKASKSSERDLFSYRSKK